MSNATNMPLGAKGDIITASAANTPSILNVGSDGEVLIADAASGGGLKWGSSSGSGEVVQVVSNSSAAVTNVGSIPLDNSIPQSGEGSEIVTVSITPTSASNYLLIRFGFFGNGSTSSQVIGALFQDATANALYALAQGCQASSYCMSAFGEHYMAAGTTSSTTFKLRVGCSTTFHVNGTTASARLLGGVAQARITVMEIGA